jgi:hypothetical protein
MPGAADQLLPLFYTSEVFQHPIVSTHGGPTSPRQYGQAQGHARRRSGLAAEGRGGSGEAHGPPQGALAPELALYIR